MFRFSSLFSFAIALLAPLASTGCGSSLPATHAFPAGHAIPLLDGPVHVGNDIAGGQAFGTGGAIAARVCSLVNLPTETDVHIQVSNLRNSETISDLLTVNGKAYPLPVTLERDPYNKTSVATVASPIHRVHLDAGPSEVCLVAGRMMNRDLFGRTAEDLDDFEVDQITLYVEDIEPSKIAVRTGLTLGRPPKSAPPSVPWGKYQD